MKNKPTIIEIVKRLDDSYGSHEIHVEKTIGVCKQTPSEVYRALFPEHAIGSYKGLGLWDWIEASDEAPPLSLSINEHDPLPGMTVTGDLWDFDYSELITPHGFKRDLVKIRQVLVTNMDSFYEVDPALRRYEDSQPILFSKTRAGD